MIASQIKQLFHRDGWIYEEKIDGWRMLTCKDGRHVRLESCNGVAHPALSELAAAVAALPGRTLVLDAEVAIFDRQLRSRFGWLRDPDRRRWRRRLS
jgi:bifunctional non-homologous end joining protein LigD